IFFTVLRFFMKQKTTIGYSFMALMTIGGEQIFSMVAFQCPCNHSQNFTYGLIFLLGPAIVLLVLGFFFSTSLWRLYTGCCFNPMKLCPRGNCFGCLKVFINIFTRACVAPIMWLSVAMLNGSFYECAVSGLMILARVPCDRSKLSSDERMELLLMLRAQSQVRQKRVYEPLSLLPSHWSAWGTYFMQLFADSQGNSSLIWKHLNKLTNQKYSQSKGITKLNINGRVSTDAMEIANELPPFSNQFRNLQQISILFVYHMM
uniref:Calcium homeostasis modulator family member 5, tandem duplicate 2 n=1 Tax=Mastacembelus armatus TaxID=205130 RepID=A0A3Q3KYG2_9TELE